MWEKNRMEKDDLVSRENVVEALYEAIRTDLRSSFTDSMSLAIAMAENIPSTEIKRKKGRWQRRKGDDCWECSECHAVLENSDIGNHNFYYCYHCGADMMDICGYMDLEKANYE